MKFNSRYLSLVGVLFLSLLSCKKSQAPNYHYEYFGLEENRYTIYNVVEIIHDNAIAQHDTLVYQLKTIWKSEFIDNEGRKMHEFERYKRDLPTDEWVFADLWTGGINGIHAELVEENQRTVKLIFAPTLNKLWDANAQNMGPELSCYYREIHVDTTVNGVYFDSTLMVEQKTFMSLIDTVRMYEVYAKNKGLIYKYSKDNHWQFGNNQVINGHEVYYEFVSSGYE